MLPHLSTSTPASNVSSADFARMEGNDKVGNSEESNALSMADILRNSPARELLGLKEDEESLPTNTETETPGKSDEEVDVPSETSDDTETATGDEQTQDDTTEDTTDADDDTSTQDTDLPTEDQIDWEYKIPVKIDGKVEYKTLEEVRKGFATDQHLSQKGRELGEAKKKIDEEGKSHLESLVQLGTVLHEELTAVESKLAKEYAELDAGIKSAKETGDTYTAKELKEKRDDVHERYWETRNKREGTAKAVVEKIQARQAEERQQLLTKFSEEISTEIPEYNEKIAKSIREFALKEGISEGILNQVYDAKIVRILNDYRKLKTAKDTGVVKRKSVPTTKSVPAKKGPTQQAVTKRESDELRTKVLSGSGTKGDENAFLKSLSKVSQKL